MTVEELLKLELAQRDEKDNDCYLSPPNLMGKCINELIEKAEDTDCDLLVCCRIPDEEGGVDVMFQAVFKGSKKGVTSSTQIMGMLHRILCSVFKDAPSSVFGDMMKEILVKVDNDLYGDKE